MNEPKLDKFLLEINSLKTASQRQLAADLFLKKIIELGYPHFESNNDALLLYKGICKGVAVLGDMGNWVESIPMNRVKDTDLYFYRGSFEKDARLEYLLEIEGEELPRIDPFNPFHSLHGLSKLSELAMPLYKRHPLFEKHIDGEKGGFENIREIEIPAGVLPYTHTLHIWLPPGYTETYERYPVVYFQDGRDYVQCAFTPEILNSLVMNKQIKPLIGVFVTPPNLHLPKEPNRSTEYGLNPDYINFFTQELVPFIDNQFRTINNAFSRLVVGDSYGGLISLATAFYHPEVFGMVYSQSGYHSFQDDRIIREIDKSKTKQLQLRVDIGTYERQVGAGFLPEKERDFFAGNRRLKEALTEKKYNFTYHEYNEGHTWGNWRKHLMDALIYFFNYRK